MPLLMLKDNDVMVKIPYTSTYNTLDTLHIYDMMPFNIKTSIGYVALI